MSNTSVNVFRAFIASLALMTIVSCATQKVTDNQICARSTACGKGIPYGSSGNTSFLRLTEKATDATYGYSKENPIKVGGVMECPANERMYLNALLGPEGQAISYERKGSCCHFETPNAIMGGGLLDVYEIHYGGIKKPIILYLNMYDKDELRIPIGFTAIQSK